MNCGEYVHCSFLSITYISTRQRVLDFCLVVLLEMHSVGVLYLYLVFNGIESLFLIPSKSCQRGE